MGTDANKALVRRLFDEVMNTGNFAPLDELFADDFLNYFPGTPAALDRAGWEHNVTLFRTAFPDLHFTVEALVAEGDTVAVAFHVQGTHQGAFQGIAPTGHRLTLPCHVLFRCADGKIVEDRPIFDRLDLLEQLGAIPAPGQATRAVGV
jgi:steroid delta-isomerase-like uncharacterized protein